MSLSDWLNMAGEIRKDSEPNRMTDAEVDEAFAELRAMNLPDMRLPD